MPRSRSLPRRGRPAHRRAGLSRRSRRRLAILLGVFVVAFGLITYRLVAIQGVTNTRLRQITQGYQRSVSLPDLRGSILASNGDELAFSEMRPTIFADPGEVTDVRGEAATLARILHQPAATLRSELSAHTTYVPLEPAAPAALGAKIKDLGLPGIGANDQPVRYHPDGNLASELLGGVNSAGKGNGALEYRYNSALTGRPGKVVESVDLQGNPIPGSVTEHTPAVNGRDVLTTIDTALEYQTHQVLSQAVSAAHASDGTAIVMDSRTGALLAVDSVVASGKRVVEAPSAQAFTNVYEPGSVAKVITVSGALADGVITPSTKLTIPDTYRVSDGVFHDDAPHPTEMLRPVGVLAQSSNIGAIQIGQRLGASRLYHYEQAYGLTQPTAVHFPAESAGLMTPLAHFSGTTLPTMAFGEANAVTAAQMVAAINTVAHGGVYVSPRLVSAIVGADGKEHPLRYPRDRRVIPASVASVVTSWMEQVVSTGTGTSAKIGPYAVAGKTGTAYARKPNGGYMTGRYDSSFAGFAPAQKPAVTALVVVDNTAGYGAEAAAPAWRLIVHDALLDRSVPPEGPQPKPSPTACPVIGGVLTHCAP